MVGTKALTVVLIVLITAIIQGCHSDFVEMKIVEEPSSLGFMQSYGYGAQHEQEDKLKLRVQPANFSGPLHFKRLIGRCFHSVIRDYKYSFCPFYNITQHEQNVHWNPYKGVLGVWQEWEVKDNKFTAMLMKDGDTCGDIYRSVKVILVCGNHSSILNTTEPNRCQYELSFMTPLVCDKDSMLVYPTLTPTLRHEWDLLEGEMAAGDLTERGYKRRLSKIFEKAGIYLSKEDHKTLVKKQQDEQIQSEGGEFDTLVACNSAYKTLKLHNEEMRHQLNSINTNNSEAGHE